MRYSFLVKVVHHTSFLNKVVLCVDFTPSLYYILMSTFLISKYMKTKHHSARLSAVALVKTSIFLVWFLFEKGFILTMTLFFFYSRKVKA